MASRKAEHENTKREQAKCDAWNSAHQVGVAVKLTKDNGDVIDTKTRSVAQVLSGHTAVIWLEGISGCYCLDRVRPA